MTKREQINEDIKTAMKSKVQTLVDVLRQLKNAITNAALATGNASNELSDAGIITVVRKQIKQREDSVKLFVEGGRPELASKESQEIEMLQKYLPQNMTDEDIDHMISLIIKETEATSLKDMGKVIKLAVERAEGRVDNRTLSQKVSTLLKK